MTVWPEERVETVDSFNTVDMTINVGPQHPATHGVFRMVLTVDEPICVQVLLTVDAEWHKLIERVRDSQLLPQLAGRFAHRFAQPNVPGSTAIEIARETVLARRAMLEQYLHLTFAGAGYPAEERLVP